MCSDATDLQLATEQSDKFISIQDAFSKKLNSKLFVQGWVKTRRDSKAGLSFIQLNDGSCFDSLQIVAATTLPNYDTEILQLTTGCSVRVVGTLVASQGKNQTVELQAETIQIIGWVHDPATYPVSPKRHTMEHLREVAHLRPRTNTFGAVTRLRHLVSQTIHQFFHDEGFYWVHTPIITANDCEGAGELFRVSTLEQASQAGFEQDFFGQETFLTVSGQLNVEAYCCALSKVYTFGPTFRAENSNTSRHLAEFWMVEPEIAFATLPEIARLAERMLKAIFTRVLAELGADMQFFASFIDKACIERLEQISEATFTQITYSEAIDLLQKAKQKFEFPVSWGLDLQSEHERYLTERVFKQPVVVTDYPQAIKGFYMRANDDGKTCAAMDILVPGIGEIIGGSQREERYDLLQQRMQAMQLDLDNYQWYLDLRQYGTVPHGGFGLGLERLLSYISGISNVRDLIPFPRTPGHAKF